MVSARNTHSSLGLVALNNEWFVAAEVFVLLEYDTASLDVGFRRFGKT